MSSQTISARSSFAYYRQQLSIFVYGSLFRLVFSRSGHEGIASSFVGNRRTDSAFSLLLSLSLSLSLSPLLRIRLLFHARWTTSTNFLLRSYVSILSVAVLTSSRPHVRYHVKITFDLLLSRKRERESEGERDKNLSEQERANCTWQNPFCCFVRSQRMSIDARGSQLIRLNGDSSLGDYLAVSSGSVMDQTSCFVSRRMFLPSRLIRPRDTRQRLRDIRRLELDLVWNYYPEIKFSSSILFVGKQTSLIKLRIILIYCFQAFVELKLSIFHRYILEINDTSLPKNVHVYVFLLL